jgi:Pyruvate/2-oxoacid:ferredoxin oxidoreductase delta subunit
MRLRDAKRVFFEYDGSRFYMSRDGVESRYANAGIPPSTEAAWLEELTQQKLAALQAKGNWRTVHFLEHHGDCRYLAEVVAVEPKGALWERCAFLEELLRYARGCVSCVGVLPVRKAIDRVIEQANRLLPKAKSEASQARIEQLLLIAKSARGKLRPKTASS